MQPWFTVYFFDIGPPCYDQLTPVKTKYPLTSITWPYRGPKFTAHRGHVFFGSWPLTKCWFSVGSRAHVRLTCWKLGRIVRRPINANPGLKVNRIKFFSSVQIFFAALFRVYGPNNTQKTSPQSYKTQIKINSTFSWVSLVGFWTTWPRSYAFRLA